MSEFDSTSIRVGDVAELKEEVTAELCTTRGDFHIFSSPSMVKLAERAAIQALIPWTSEVIGTVGSSVTLRHLAPTPLGMEVTLLARVVAVEGRRIDFVIEIADEIERVGEVEHTRYFIDISKYSERLRTKLSAWRER